MCGWHIVCVNATVQYHCFDIPVNNPCLVSQIYHVVGIQSGDNAQYLKLSCIVLRNGTVMYDTVRYRTKKRVQYGEGTSKHFPAPFLKQENTSKQSHKLQNEPLPILVVNFVVKF
jgi:uncharacterized membrane protein YecN with MAPEG domain